MGFPNKSGDHKDTDDVLAAELTAAGIPYEKHILQNQGEVKSSVIGKLHGWTFRRGWYYWIGHGPGIELAVAEKLHALHGKDVRVDGHGGCPSPLELFEGLACGHYHIDSPEGLKALADTIRLLVERAKASEGRNCGIRRERQPDATDDLLVARAKACKWATVAGKMEAQRDHVRGCLREAMEAIRRLLESHDFPPRGYVEMVQRWERTLGKPDDLISGHVEYETLTLCGVSTCSDECWKSWAFCPYCGKPFVAPKEDEPVTVGIQTNEVQG